MNIYYMPDIILDLLDPDRDDAEESTEAHEMILGRGYTIATSSYDFAVLMQTIEAFGWEGSVGDVGNQIIEDLSIVSVDTIVLKSAIKINDIFGLSFQYSVSLASAISDPKCGAVITRIDPILDMMNADGWSEVEIVTPTQAISALTASMPAPSEVIETQSPEGLPK